ncbi:MAG: SbcC/MukB-like Walker B domain-containing protein [Rhodothermales bacterium]
MVPVELSLSNFLSYGAEPQTLDFSQFHVACLSGKNGQGKSALLDAITWVLWGEARKSSGGHKPDDELLRIGARRMKVELVFDVESVRYRVMRAYSRSATGKTSKAEMELQVLDTGTDEGRPLTQSSIRESQNFLNEILGLDYHTFINSAFLLQGRSDEFTKKKPNERKDILGRILNLGKYDKLSFMARDKQRVLTAEVDVRKRENDRLVDALEPEGVWKELSAEVTAALKEKQDALEEVRRNESGIVEQLGAIDAQVKAAEALNESIARMREQKRIQEEEKNLLDVNIKKAKDLVVQAKDIEVLYNELMTLIEEREALDSSREVYRGIERQIEQKKNELQQYRQDSEQKIKHLELELKVGNDSLAEIESRLEGKEKYEADLSSAKAAKERVDQIREKIAQRELIQNEITQLEKKASGKRESILGHLKSLEERKSAVRSGTVQKQSLLQDQARFGAQVEEQIACKEELEEITKKGQLAGEVIKSSEGEIGALSNEKGRIQEQFAQLQDLEQSQCPTCGSELTTKHREEVAGQLSSHLAEIEDKIAGNQKLIDTQTLIRNQMRDSFRALKEKSDKLADAGERLALAGEQLKTVVALEQEGLELEAKINQLKNELEQQSYAREEFDQLNVLNEKITAIALDDEALEKDRFKANQIVRYEEHLRNILHAEGRKESLLEKNKALKRQIDQARVKIDDGAHVLALRQGIADIEKQLGATGFDPVRFEEVRRKIKELGHVQSQYKDLLNAQQNLSDWEAQVERLVKRIEQIASEIDEHVLKHKNLVSALGGRVDLEASLKEIKAQRGILEKNAQDLQMQAGELSAKLEQAKKDRQSLKEGRARLKEVKSEENLYSKLRRAFSKQGIPSLIIEQSLPEIEDRTNDLLTRLADGKMRVTLETLRDKKTGGTKETLEIIITDEQGVPRAYETFSGGEAFRVNFALRIALSQMLAERSGVRIRTLGIDEGFGTQDEEGIQNLIEALQVIQEDFDKIIVITHLERLKEAFPVRIEVEKHPVDGSRFTMIRS